MKAAMQTGTGIAAPQSIGDPRTYLFPHWKQCSSPGNNPAVPVLQSPGTHVLSPAWRQSDTFPQSTVLGCSLLSPQAAQQVQALQRLTLRLAGRRCCTRPSGSPHPSASCSAGDSECAPAQPGALLITLGGGADGCTAMLLHGCGSHGCKRPAGWADAVWLEPHTISQHSAKLCCPAAKAQCF